MDIEYRYAKIEDAEILTEIYDAAFYDDYIKYGECPGYGKTVEAMRKSIIDTPKFIIICDNKPVGVVSCKNLEGRVYEVGCLCIIPEFLPYTQSHFHFVGGIISIRIFLIIISATIDIRETISTKSCISVSVLIIERENTHNAR